MIISMLFYFKVFLVVHNFQKLINYFAIYYINLDKRRSQF